MKISIPTVTSPLMGRGQTSTIWHVDEYPYMLRSRLARKLSRMQVSELNVSLGKGVKITFRF